MDYLRISKFTEQDFDEVVALAGGTRYTENPHVDELNCDYVINNSVVELKILEEEPIAKLSKQAKLASLFRSDIKTVILNPLDLDAEGKRKYYQELSTPIKTAVRHASKQLAFCAEKIGASRKIAVVINNGLTMTSPDEFQEITVNRVKNDTSGIDILIVAGIYLFSDGFDSFVFFELSDHQISGPGDYELVERMRWAWGKVIEKYMTKQIVERNLERNKSPVRDLFFEQDGIRYVKPPIQWGKQSSFFGAAGRPREDSTGMDSCPPVATVIPIFDIESYEFVKSQISENSAMRNSLIEYLGWADQEVLESNDLLRPLVLVKVPLGDIIELGLGFTYEDINSLAVMRFQTDVKNVIEQAIEFPSSPVSLNYILVQVNEVGIDKANDIAFISHNLDSLGDEKQDFVVRGERMKFEYALTLASAYCLAKNADIVYYLKNEDFKWK